MKAVILAGGRGSRINEVTRGGNKCLLKAKDKTLIQYNVKHLCEIEEITECIIVVGYHAEDVMREIGNQCKDKKITYCIQTEQNGLIGALESARYALDGEDFIMVLGDEFIIDNQYQRAITDFKKSNVACMVGIIAVDDIDLVKRTYTFNMNEEGEMTDFVEKPQKPFNRYMGTGNVIFKGGAIHMLDKVPINPIRNERELVGFFNMLINKDEKITSFVVGSHYVNVNTSNDLELLEKIIA